MRMQDGSRDGSRFRNPRGNSWGETGQARAMQCCGQLQHRYIGPVLVAPEPPGAANSPAARHLQQQGAEDTCTDMEFLSRHQSLQSLLTALSATRNQLPGLYNHTLSKLHAAFSSLDGTTHATNPLPLFRSRYPAKNLSTVGYWLYPMEGILDWYIRGAAGDQEQPRNTKTRTTQPQSVTLVDTSDAECLRPLGMRFHCHHAVAPPRAPWDVSARAEWE